jgi:hypothetical protein
LRIPERWYNQPHTATLGPVRLNPMYWQFQCIQNLKSSLLKEHFGSMSISR